ncbi:MAG: hypothetical protein ACT4OI_03970 [Methanobacteriota archaeon]
MITEHRKQHPGTHFSLLFRIVEEDYGPEGDVCILPSQMLALEEELQEFLGLAALADETSVVYKFWKATLTAGELRVLVDRLLEMVRRAEQEEECIFGFAD